MTFSLINPRVRDLWADALEGGEFQRGVGALATLRSDDSEARCYCCLGVLTELYHRDTGLGRWVSRNDSSVILEFHDTDEDGQPGGRGTVYLTPAVRRWAGLNRSNPVLDPEGDVDPEDADAVQRLLGYGDLKTATSLNDSGTPFPEIAALVRQMPAREEDA